MGMVEQHGGGLDTRLHHWASVELHGAHFLVVDLRHSHHVGHSGSTKREGGSLRKVIYWWCSRVANSVVISKPGEAARWDLLGTLGFRSCGRWRPLSEDNCIDFLVQMWICVRSLRAQASVHIIT